MIVAFIAFILLMIYSAWMTYNWVKSKSMLIEARQEADATKSLLLRDQKNREIEKVSYEARLKAKQDSIIALRKYILEKTDGNNMVDVLVGMHEDADPSTGSSD